MKLAINTMIHGINQTFAEAITLAQGAEITPDYAFNVIEASAACAPMLTYRRPLYMDETPYDVTFTVTLAEKDMCIATDLARSSGVATPQGDVTLSVLSKAKNDGFGHRDIAAILNYMRKGNSRKRQHYLPVAGTAMTPALADWCAYLLLSEGFVVDVYATLSPLADPFNLAGVDLIVPIWSSARSSHKIEFENMTKSEEDRLLKLIAARCGIGGWHRHMGDAFRDRPTYHFMIGGQFVAHPPGWPDNAVPSDDFIDYDVTITAPTHEVVAGIDSFRMLSEQYYMLVDPSNAVLATTTFSGEHLWWIEGATIPVVWTRRWDKGRVFYFSIGHTLDDLKVPQVTQIIRRGLIWAAR